MKLALGTVQFGVNYGVSNVVGKTSNEEVAHILSIAKAHNIHTIDTAAAYGDAEKVLGEADVSEFEVVSKLPPKAIDNRSEKQIINSSLEKLQLKKLHALMCHNAEDLLTNPNLYGQLLNVKNAGLCDKIGVSVYDTETTSQILDRYKIDIIQLPMNILDQRFLRQGFLEQLQREGVEIHVRSAFLQGLLLMPKAQRPDYFKQFTNLLNKFDLTLEQHQITALSATLGFLKQQANVDKIVIGVNNHVQLNEIIDCYNQANFTIDFSTLACDNLALINPSLWQL